MTDTNSESELNELIEILDGPPGFAADLKRLIEAKVAEALNCIEQQVIGKNEEIEGSTVSQACIDAQNNLRYHQRKQLSKLHAQLTHCKYHDDFSSEDCTCPVPTSEEK